MRKFVVSRYEVGTKVHKGWSGTRIVVLSDFHNNSYGIDEEQLYKTIEMENPEFVIIAGDMYTGDARCSNGNAAAFLEKLSARYKVYFGIGNHEHRIMERPNIYLGMGEDIRATIKKTGIEFLTNDKVILCKNGDKLAIYGLMIDLEYYEYYKKFKKINMKNDYIGGLIGEPEKEAYNILIAHHPQYFEQYALWGADLVISGHVHGGMARIPFLGGVIGPDYRLFPKYDKGMFRIKDSTMILSAGIGMHTINIRPFNPPELVVIELK